MCTHLLLYIFVCFFLFCFFKQKTAYEMRISDWSSDVCSSDLPAQRFDLVEQPVIARHMLRRFGAQRRMRQKSQQPEPIIDRDDDNAPLRKLRAVVHRFRTAAPDQRAAVDPDHDRQLARIRSEEHTSELQSLMRISYAVFCLKKKTKRE